MFIRNEGCATAVFGCHWLLEYFIAAIDRETGSLRFLVPPPHPSTHPSAMSALLTSRMTDSERELRDRRTGGGGGLLLLRKRRDGSVCLPACLCLPLPSLPRSLTHSLTCRNPVTDTFFAIRSLSAAAAVSKKRHFVFCFDRCLDALSLPPSSASANQRCALVGYRATQILVYPQDMETERLFWTNLFSE